jgi:hypothetical protein
MFHKRSNKLTFIKVKNFYNSKDTIKKGHRLEKNFPVKYLIKDLFPALI